MTRGNPGQGAGPDPAGGVPITGGIRACVFYLQWMQVGGGRPRARERLSPGAEWAGTSVLAVRPPEQGVGNERLMVKPLGLWYFAAGAVSNTPTGRRLQ